MSPAPYTLQRLAPESALREGRPDEARALPPGTPSDLRREAATWWGDRARVRQSCGVRWQLPSESLVCTGARPPQRGPALLSVHARRSLPDHHPGARSLALLRGQLPRPMPRRGLEGGVVRGRAAQRLEVGAARGQAKPALSARLRPSSLPHLCRGFPRQARGPPIVFILFRRAALTCEGSGRISDISSAGAAPHHLSFRDVRAASSSRPGTACPGQWR